MEIEFVYFDLDDTLLDHQDAERKALADVRARYLALFGALSVDELQDAYHTINAPLWRRYADGEIGKQTVQQQRFERLLAAVEAPHADAPPSSPAITCSATPSTGPSSQGRGTRSRPWPSATPWAS